MYNLLTVKIKPLSTIPYPRGWGREERRGEEGKGREWKGREERRGNLLLVRKYKNQRKALRFSWKMHRKA